MMRLRASKGLAGLWEQGRDPGEGRESLWSLGPGQVRAVRARNLRLIGQPQLPRQEGV